MINIDIPGLGQLNLLHAVFDYNGTLSVGGRLLDGVAPRLNMLANDLKLHVITGDTFGTAKSELNNVNCEIKIIPQDEQRNAKKEYIHALNPDNVIAIGNGSNDQYMLKSAALGITVLGGDGTSIKAALAADVLTKDIFEALSLLQDPRRLIATLRE